MKRHILQTRCRALTFLGEESGAAGTEYAILLAFVVLAAVGAIASLGGSVAATSDAIGNGVPAGSGPG